MKKKQKKPVTNYTFVLNIYTVTDSCNKLLAYHMVMPELFLEQFQETAKRTLAVPGPLVASAMTNGKFIIFQ